MFKGEDGDSMESACLEIVEPLDGEVFRITVSEFIAYVHKDGRVEGNEEKEEFVHEAFSAYGVHLEIRDMDEYSQVSSMVVTDENFASFVPEAMFAAG